MSVQTELNRADITSLAWLTSKVKLGDLLTAIDAILNGAAIHEAVAMTANVGTLSRPAMAILGMDARAGTVTGTLLQMADDATLVTKSIKVGLNRQTLTTFATDAVSSVVVTYIPVPAVTPANTSVLAGSP